MCLIVDANLCSVVFKKTNDTHVIALARANRKRGHVLCAEDEALQTDFKNKALIDNPHGTIDSPTRHKESASLANC